MKLPRDLLDKFGIKRTEIIFTKPIKAMIRYYDEAYDITKENVTSIDIDQNPVFTSITVTYKTETGEGSIGSSAENIKEIIVAND